MIKITNRFEPIINKPKLKLPSIRVYNRNFGELVTTHSTDRFSPQWITTELRSRLNKKLGYEILSLDKNRKKGLGASLEVEKEYRQKNNRFGEILRLSSIIGILENDISEFEIHSKPGAIYFHSKYKFEPQITEFQQRDDALQSIINNSKIGFDYYKKEAENLQEKICFYTDDETQRRLCIDTSALVGDYIQKVSETEKEYLNHPFSTGLRMILKKDKIIENKEFFNDLFAKHVINYKI